MKTYCFSILIALLATSPVLAQDQPSATAYSVEGRVKYTPAAKGWFQFKSLQPGTTLSKTGRLKVKRGGSVAILHDGDYLVLQEKAKLPVKEALQDASLFRKSPYARLFEDYVKRSEHPYFRQPQVLGFVSNNTTDNTRQSLGGSMGPVKPPTKEEGSGHGESGAALLALSPNGGKVAGKSAIFRWAHKEQVSEPEAYRLVIYTDDGKQLLEQPVDGTSIELDLAGLSLEPGRYYKWKAGVDGAPEENTSEIPFLMEQVKELEAIQQKLYESEMYRLAGPAAQLLLEAALLEEEGYQALAYNKYEQAATRHSQNELAVAMYKTFLWRYGQKL